MENEFQGNSHSEREERPRRKSEKQEKAPKEIKQIATGRVRTRKKPLRKRIAETFTGDDQVGVMEYVLLDVLVPGVKDIIADVSTTAIERSLFGGDVRSSRRSRHGGSYTSYNRMSNSSRRDRGGRGDRDDDRRDRRRDRGHEQREYLCASRVEADEILDTMIECISKYDSVSKRDLLSMLGESHNYTDEDWGWYDLRGARVHRVGRDYLIDLPRPEPLD